MTPMLTWALTPMLTWELTHPTEQKQQTRVTQTLARPYDQTPHLLLT